jgi:putative protease
MNEIQGSKSTVPALPELLAPAGSFEKLVTAIHYGADAVYLSGKRYGLRAKAVNFDDREISQAVSYAHAHGVKVYVTVNIIAHNDDFAGLTTYLEFLADAQVDAIIVSDPGILQVARQTVPNLSIHLSTQANVTNLHAAKFWIGHGLSRLNLARELSFGEIRAIRAHVEAELEVFVHGALCISYSGRCMLSNYLTGRDANRGNCAHPCRYRYSLMEEKRPGEYFPVIEDERGTYIFNSKDLCLLPRLPELVALGTDSLKIEGRMKSIFYVGGVVRVYRAALDYLGSLPAEAWRDPVRIEIPASIMEEIERTGTRGMSENFADHQPSPDDMLYDESRIDQQYEPVGVIRDAGSRLKVELRNVCQIGDSVEFMDTGLTDRWYTVRTMLDDDAIEIERANPGDTVYWILESSDARFTVNSMFRRKKRAPAGP